MTKVSIITPIYNCEDYLEQTIKSVVSQTYQHWEMIIVDDCSTDNSFQIAQKYAAQDNRFIVLKLDKNSGAAVARNVATEAASGRFIAFLDSDDLWNPDKLDQQLSFMLKNNYAFTYSAYEKINESGEVFGLVNVPTKVSYKNLLKTNVIGCLTSIYDAKQLGKVYMPTNTKREDFATWLNILKHESFAYGLNISLAQYRVYVGQSSSKKARMAHENWKLYRKL